MSSSSSSTHINKKVKLSKNIQKCDICDRTFEGYKQLNNHKRIHSSSSSVETDKIIQDNTDENISDTSKVYIFFFFFFFNIYVFHFTYSQNYK